jgi:hypothetical protein
MPKSRHKVHPYTYYLQQPNPIQPNFVLKEQKIQIANDLCMSIFFLHTWCAHQEGVEPLLASLVFYQCWVVL